MPRFSPLARQGRFDPNNPDQLAKQISLLEKALQAKNHNDSTAAPYVITDKKTSIYNAKAYEVVHADTSAGDVPVLLPDPTTCLGAWTGVKFHTGDTNNVVHVSALNSDIDGMPWHELSVPGQFAWYYAGLTGWRIGDTNARNSPVYVDDFGAYGDDDGTGTVGHDDTAAFQAAIDYAKKFSGIIVALSAGKKYRLDGVLDTDDGAGFVIGTTAPTAGYANGAWMVFTGAPSSSFMSFGNSRNCGLEGVTVIVTNRAFNYSRGAVAASRASDTNSTGYFRVRNCFFGGPIDNYVVTNVTGVGPTIEITTSTSHGLSTGTYVYLSGLTNVVAGPPVVTTPLDCDGLAFQITVTAVNKFTIVYTPNVAWTAGGAVQHSTVPRMLHLGLSLNSHVHHCNFQGAQIHIWGQGEGIAQPVVIDGGCTFANYQNCAIACPGQAWTIEGNTFEDITAIDCPGATSAIQGLSIISNWFGDGVAKNIWIKLFNGQGVHIHGNLLSNSTTPISLRAGSGIVIAGNNCSDNSHIVGFTGPETTTFVHIGPNAFSGADSAMIDTTAPTFGAHSAHIVLEGNAFGVDGQMSAPSGVLGGAFQTGTNAPVPTGNNITLASTLGTKPTFDAKSGALICFQAGSTFTDSPGNANYIAFWPPQNDHNSGHGFYAYDPAIATFKQRLAHWLGPKYRIHYGSAAFAKGGQLEREMMLYADAISSGSTAALLAADGSAAFTLTNGFLYNVVARFTVTDTAATPAKRYSATAKALIGCVGGAATILNAGGVAAISDIVDPDTAGNTVSITVSGAVVSFNATIASGATSRAVCFVESIEMVTS